MENPTAPNPPGKPNIILITVDQMRFPMNFPKDMDIDSPEKFIGRYMPNLNQYLWQPGVKFSNYYTAASDCTAARATIHTGLYAYQTYSMLTLITYPPKLSLQPMLHPDFPTIGKLMRPDYDTPYFGKWHLSYEVDNLEMYGYNSHTNPEDLVGLQGEGMETDGEVARRAAEWIIDHNAKDPLRPFFLNVNFINPHDKQWFWGGMQATDYNLVYDHFPAEAPPQNYTQDYPREAYPSWDDYKGDIQQAIDNWEPEKRLTEKKPGVQTILKEVFQYQMGGIYESDEQSTYIPLTEPAGFMAAVTPLRDDPSKGQVCHKAIAPYEYWTKALNSYLEVMTMVDNHIGEFMSQIPPSVMANSIFLFTSDHGEYGSSHGLQGKGGSIYEEGIRVPLVVYDPSNRYFNSNVPYRDQLCSSVDLLRLIVTMGHDGTTDWMQGPYKDLYASGSRIDLLNILRDPRTAGRDYALHTTDEFVPDALNYLHAPLHVIGMISFKEGADKKRYKQKLGVYTRWEEYVPGQPQARVRNVPQDPNITQLEYYDFFTEGGRQETDNTSTSPDARAAHKALMDGPTSILATELQMQLPAIYREAQEAAYGALRWYMINANNPVMLGSEQETEQVLALAWAL